MRLQDELEWYFEPLRGIHTIIPLSPLPGAATGSFDSVLDTTSEFAVELTKSLDTISEVDPAAAESLDTSPGADSDSTASSEEILEDDSETKPLAALDDSSSDETDGTEKFSSASSSDRLSDCVVTSASNKLDSESDVISTLDDSDAETDIGVGEEEDEGEAPPPQDENSIHIATSPPSALYTIATSKLCRILHYYNTIQVFALQNLRQKSPPTANREREGRINMNDTDLAIRVYLSIIALGNMLFVALNIHQRCRAKKKRGKMQINDTKKEKQSIK